MRPTHAPRPDRRTFLRQLGVTLASAAGLVAGSPRAAHANEEPSSQCGVICYRLDACGANCGANRANYRCVNQCTGQVSYGCKSSCASSFCLTPAC
jgi:hypothetical protein